MGHCTTHKTITMIPWTSTIETLLATADNQDTPNYVTPTITKAMAPLDAVSDMRQHSLTEEERDILGTKLYTTKELDVVCDMRQHELDVLMTEVQETLIHKGQGRTTTMEIGMEDNNMDTIMDGDDSPTGAPLSNTIQQVWGYMLQAIAFAKGVVTSLTNRGVPKYLMVVLLLLTTNWLGNIIYNGMPAPLGGIPTAIGAAYLCPLVLRANREKLVEAMREYLG